VIRSKIEKTNNTNNKNAIFAIILLDSKKSLVALEPELEVNSLKGEVLPKAFG
jgi:hypothetical protein